ncbi:hypothetical protein HU200_042780 [Digitaria exilis]|uniref:Uncharacterized protein n=1 Tax=Digitaria exilis TaxID=1010633 RepID=A0A835B5N8_9POAL|nr:hypothetical protein HU200_042780 [Digitaria exilis]
MSATVASARPMKPSSSEGDDTRVVVVEASARDDIQTVVGKTTAAAEEHGGEAGCGGHRFMSIDMLGGVKDSGPSPGAGH